MKRANGIKYGVHCLLAIGDIGSPPSTKLPQAQYIQLPNGEVCIKEQYL